MCSWASNRALLKLVGRPTWRTFFGSSGGRNACGSGAGERHQPGVETLPDTGVGVALDERSSLEPGNPLQVRQRRHVHDRQARHLGRGDAPHQLANARCSVLRLLHGKHDQVEQPGVGFVRCTCPKLTAASLRGDLHRGLSTPDRQPDRGSTVVDELGGRLGTHQCHRVPGEQRLGAQQRAVGSAQNQYVVFRHSLLDCPLLARRLDFVVIESDDGLENVFGVLAQQRRAFDLCGRIRQLYRVAHG